MTVRESPRAKRARATFRPGQGVELVVPAGTPRRSIERHLRAHSDWIVRTARAAPTPKLALADVPLTAAEGRAVALERIVPIVEEEAPRLGVVVRRISVRDQRTRWGSCSARGTLSFNWRLVLAPHEVLDYVVVHELCHLREQNHSPRFWALVEELRPDYRAQKQWLKRHGWELLAARPSETAQSGV